MSELVLQQTVIKITEENATGLVPYSFGAVVVWYGLSWWNWEPKEVRTPQETFVFGCLASFLAHQFSYPWTTIQRLQQV